MFFQWHRLCTEQSLGSFLLLCLWMLHSGAMQLKAKPKSLSGAVEAGLYYREARDERGTFLVGLLFHNTEKSMCSLMWQKKKKKSTSFAFFSEEICSIQAINDENVYSKSCTSVIPCSYKLLHWQTKLKSWLFLLSFREHCGVCNKQNPWEQRSFLTKFQNKMQGQHGTGCGFLGFWILLFFFWFATVAKQLVSVYSSYSSSVVSFPLSLGYPQALRALWAGRNVCLHPVLRWLLSG